MASRPPEYDPPSEETARARFFMLNAVRLMGVALVVIGLAVLQGKIDLPEAVGWSFVPLGLLDIFVIPQILARKWRSPPG